MTSSILRPKQYQIGDFVFGDGTLFNVEQFDVAGYEVNVQDFQASSSDEIRFGSDSLKPMPIQLTINAFQNRALENIVALTKYTGELDFSDDPTVGEFVREWRDDSTRKNWGELKPLIVCREDGTPVRVYGRPGKLAVSKPDPNAAYRKLIAEFRRSDTLAYSNYEWLMNLQQTEVATAVRASQFGMGNAPSWLRLLFVGPMTNPIAQIGSLTVELATDIENGDMVEVSAYPWARRVVRASDGASLASSLVSPYLDKLQFPANSPIEVSWNATNVNTVLGSVGFSSLSGWSTIQYFGPSGAAGTMGVSGNLLRWTASGTKERAAVMIRNTDTLSNYQLVGMTMANPAEDVAFGSDPVNRIIGRSNTAGTQYLYWDITFRECWYGYHLNGTDYRLSKVFKITNCLETLQRIIGNAFSSSFGLTGAPVENWDYEVEFGNAGELSSTLRVNGHTFAVTAPNLGGEAEIDPNSIALSATGNRRTGLGMGAMSKGILGQSMPGTVSQFWYKDNPPPEVAATLNASAVIMLWRDAWYEI